MGSPIDTFEYVLGSAARRAVLREVAREPRTPQALLSAVDASESSVYDALNRLEDRGLVSQRSDTWVATGAGRLVADLIGRCETVESLIDEDRTFWEAHDSSSLPGPFRERLDELAGYRVVRSTDTDPYRAERVVERTIREGESIAILAPIFNDRYAEALFESDATEKRLLVTPAMAEGLAETNDLEMVDDDLLDAVSIGLFPTSFALTVTDRTMLLSLPQMDGSYDQQAELLADSESAVAWANELFDRCWGEATMVDPDERPDAES